MDRGTSGRSHELSDLQLALHLGAVAAPLALSYFHGLNESWTKSDGSLVSAADMAVDAALRDELTRLRPSDGVLTEESEEVRFGERPRWIIDPVDGTHEFIAGGTEWGTNIALELDDEIVLGVVTRPVQGTRWWAARGLGAHVQHGDEAPMRLAVSARSTLSECRLTAWPDDHPITRRVASAAGWAEADMTCVPRLLAGELEAVFALRAGPWDFAPAVVLVEEAGGAFRDLEGGRSIFQGAAVFSNGLIANHVARLLAPADE